jgi:sulfatase maturation enzyme AslB (radical SAM superfamily)
MKVLITEAAEKFLISLHSSPFIYPLTLHLAKKVFSSTKIWGTITIEPYNVCNLRCRMCSYRKMTRRKDLMNMDLYKKIVDDKR